MSRSIAVLLTTSMAALLGVAAIARADVVYEWTDAKGEVHYTDQWVPGAKVIRTETSHRSPASAAQGIQSEDKAASSQLQQQHDADAVQQDEAKARAERCSQEKAQYERLIQSRRIYTTDKSGQRQYLSDADADAARLKARQAMDADCGT
ncbi:MAG: DUF4124 domain-containing protein [Gammaproteobacteria bacterium]|nr:DUF4124 domain-containing protein [Gammaproteobacteria bacterium]